MAAPIRMPDLGTTVDECMIMGWRVAEGDTVALGDILADIETDKAIIELESVAAGVVLKLLAEADAMVQVGDVLAYIGEPGEALPEEAPAAPVAVAPLVRNLAAKLGVDLATVTGTGQGGVLTREDVQRASQAPVAPAEPEGAALSRVQEAVARAVASSWADKPHTYFTAAVDMTAAVALRERAQAEGSPLSHDALLLAAMAAALPEFPALRSVWQEGRVVAIPGLHLAVAIGREQELFLPVIFDVDRLSLAQVQAQLNELVAEIQAGTLPASRLTGACLALTNLGMFPIESFDPIIFPEHSAILAAGAVTLTPVAVDGQVVIRPIMRMTLAADHRVINGRTAAGFLAAVKAHLETV
ncbi:MAG TPA: dihydrolipoamide acetyltransferase family protein [Armatimonadota bacterium]|jgi:pyruvate dehydrogenase E2 component (dihydrolipoamide acetyltransferase)